MRKWALVLAAVAVVAAVAGYVGNGARAGSRAQDCEDWVNETFERVNVARSILYPPERADAVEGSDLERAQALFDLADEQLNAEPPDDAFQLDGDLLEALQAGAAGFEAGGAEGGTLIYFAKSIFYNADARLVALINSEGC